MLEAKNISWSVPSGKKIIKNIDLSIKENKLVVITGPNGSGKTSLAKLIAGIERADEGSFFLDGTDITDFDVTQRAKSGIAFAFQQPVSFKGITVYDILKLSNNEADDEEISKTLLHVGLQPERYLSRDVDSHLSGGEMKRIEIATVLLRNCKYTIFDEPEAGIDIWSFRDLIEIFENYKKNSEKAFIIISHQEKILSIADEIILINDGKIEKHGTKDEVYPELFCCKSGECHFCNFTKE